MGIVTLLTDFGTGDYYVAAVKGVLLEGAPGCLPIDVSHAVAPGDVAEAAFLLGAASRYFPGGTVHLAVVDPGVGSPRRILAAERDGQRFVAPDNGLLTPVLAGATVWSVERRELFRDAPGETFHGRDRFAPVAAYLARGEPAAELGPEIPDPVRLDLPPPRRGEAGLEGRVVHVDRFGNLVTDLPSGWLPAERSVEARVGGATIRRRARFYAELPPGEAAILPGSLGTLELSVRDDSLARRLGVGAGAGIRILFR